MQCKSNNNNNKKKKSLLELRNIDEINLRNLQIKLQESFLFISRNI